jgi:hypothetical protein
MSHPIAAMLSGMLVMIVPAFLVCVGISVLAYRRRGSPEARPAGRRVRR